MVSPDSFEESNPTTRSLFSECDSSLPIEIADEALQDSLPHSHYPVTVVESDGEDDSFLTFPSSLQSPLHEVSHLQSRMDDALSSTILPMYANRIFPTHCRLFLVHLAFFLSLFFVILLSTPRLSFRSFSVVLSFLQKTKVSIFC